MSPARAILDAALEMGCAPWPRFRLDAAGWLALRDALATDASLELLGLWAEPGLVHAAFLDRAAGAALLATGPVQEGSYPALSPVRPGAALFERAIADLWGIMAEGGVDGRPWLDHGRWPVSAPLSPRPPRHEGAAPPMTFLPAEGEGVHSIPVGPIHAGIIEPGHFRFHVQGETIVRLEARLGYTHKGTLGLMRGRSPRVAARFAARLSGDSTVAHSLAFARAAEAALRVAPPPRAAAWRAVMLELERLHNHLNDMGFIANDAAFAALHAEAGLLREGLLRAVQAAFGHRLMMDRVVPGGVAMDPAPEAIAPLRRALDAVRAGLPRLLRLYESHASLLDRTMGTGVLPPALVAGFAPGGVVGRSAGRGFDARLLDGTLSEARVLDGADVDARWRLRHAEAAASAAAVAAWLDALPEGPVSLSLPAGGGEGVALVEGFRGDCLAWMALDDGGLIQAIFLRDPSWLHWPLLEASVLGNIVADFPLINKSINASYSGVDL